MDRAAEITEYLRGERRQMPAKKLIGAIIADATVNPAWPKGTWLQWRAAIDEAVERGLIVRDRDWLAIAPPPEVAKEVQGELF